MSYGLMRQKLSSLGTTIDVWRKQVEAFHPNKTIPTVKHGWDSIMLRGCFAAAITGQLQIVDGIMRKGQYLRAILKHNLKFIVSQRVLTAIGIMKVQKDCDGNYSLILKMESLHGKPDSNLFEGIKL